MKENPLLNSRQFRYIITFLKNNGMRVSAMWLVNVMSGIGIRDSREYVMGCNVVSVNGELCEDKNESNG